MALTADEQELYDLAKKTLPAWYADDERANEFLGACAKMFGAARAISEHWLKVVVYITLATVDTATNPDWLDQHARDRGTSRQDGESDEALIARLRNIEDLVTRPALLAAVQAMMDDAGFTGAPAMVEFPRDVAYFGESQSFGGAGGYTLTKSGTTMRFTPAASPAAQFARPPFWRAPRRDQRYQLTLAGNTSPANDGTFDVTGLLGAAATFTNASGVAEAAPGGASWLVEHLDPEGNVRDGFDRAYFGRGYRMSHTPPSGIVVILPFGTTEGFRLSVLEMLRQKAAGGIRIRVERRLIP